LIAKELTFLRAHKRRQEFEMARVRAGAAGELSEVYSR